MSRFRQSKQSDSSVKFFSATQYGTKPADKLVSKRSFLILKPAQPALPRPIYENHPEWVDLYYAAWQMAVGNIEPSPYQTWKEELSCMPGTGKTWVWDSCFMSFFAIYGNGIVPSMNNLDNLYSIQRPDGYIPMAYSRSARSPAFGERVNPPLFAWVESNYWRRTGDDSRISRVLPILVRLFHWYKANRRRLNKLYWFEDSGSSGMDNSPRSAYASPSLRGSDVCFVDLASQQALSAIHIAELARHINDEETAESFDREYEDLKALINHYHWNDKTRFYYDVFDRDDPRDRHNHLNHKTVASFWPLVAGICSEAQAAALVEHLLDPSEFRTPHAVPSLSRDDPNYDPFGGYWLGGVWAPANYMIIQGLNQYGYFELSRQLATNHIEGIASVWQSEDFHSIWEAYSPEYRRPSTKEGGTLVRPDFIGWSGLGPIAMLIENILGIDMDAPKERVTWRIWDHGRTGLENLILGKHILSLSTSAPKVINGGVSIAVETNKPVALKSILRDYPPWERNLSSGAHEIFLANP